MKTVHYRAAALAALLAGAAASVHADPVPLPDPQIPGYHFPEPEATLLGWVNQPTDANRQAIDLHGWGLWASLTAPSGQTEFGIQNVPVYLTWLSPQEIAKLPPGTTPNALKLAHVQRALTLGLPTQFLRSKSLIDKLNKEAKLEKDAAKHRKLLGAASSTPMSVRDTDVTETVGYDPSAAAFAQQNNLFSLAALRAIYKAGNASIPAFPDTAVTIKPVYKVVSKAHSFQNLYVMPAWPGTPEVITPKIKSEGFPESSWPGCVYVDNQNTGTSTASGVDPTCKGPTANSTYGLGDFIHATVTKDNINQIKSTSSLTDIELGDTVILVAMHVTSREMTEWTWQSYFWTPDPANPPLPSSAEVASHRPAQLTGPAAHYAMTIGYQMVAPNQPVDGGKSVGEPVIAYNPYLESGFNAATFGPTPANPGITNPATGKTYTATVGVQTNCMACHGTASAAFDGSKRLAYLTDMYLSRTDPVFQKHLQTEFLWSIPDNAK